MSTPHARPDKKEKIGITLSMVYWFMNDEDDDNPSLPGVLIIWDDNHECLWALPVERKGPVEWVVTLASIPCSLCLSRTVRDFREERRCLPSELLQYVNSTLYLQYHTIIIA